MRYILFPLVFSVALSAYAATEQVSASSSDIRRSISQPKTENWRLGVEGELGYSSLSGVLLGLNLNPEKFISPKLSIGARIGYANTNLKNYEKYELGPSATYLFWTHNAFRAYGHQALFVSKYTGSRVKNDDLDFTSLTEFGIGWSVIDAYLFHQELLDKSNLYSSGTGFGMRLMFTF